MWMQPYQLNIVLSILNNGTRQLMIYRWIGYGTTNGKFEWRNVVPETEIFY